MARSWTNARMEVMTRSGTLLSGRFLRVEESALFLSAAQGSARPVPIRDLHQIAIKRRPSDLAFVALLGLGVGALFGGAGALGLETDETATAVLSASGALLGVTIGWKTIYQNTVITFE
jgi:hypothetical protein